jgi:hypothetical protein
LLLAPSSVLAAGRAASGSEVAVRALMLLLLLLTHTLQLALWMQQ